VLLAVQVVAVEIIQVLVVLEQVVVELQDKVVLADKVLLRLLDMVVQVVVVQVLLAEQDQHQMVEVEEQELHQVLLEHQLHMLAVAAVQWHYHQVEVLVDQEPQEYLVAMVDLVVHQLQ
jgi:hypothetical protein